VILLWAMLGSMLLASWGLRWDIQWHQRIGRDSFWIAPHLMTYAGVTLLVFLSFGTLVAGTLRPVTGRLRMFGLVGTPGAHLAAWGIALTVLAAPIDDLWHRLFGLDVTLWSPPHLLGLVGAAVNTLGCLVIAREVYPAGSRGKLAATLVAAAMFYGTLRVASSQAFEFAHGEGGGVAFHGYAILGALLFPLALVPAARLTGLRAAPLLVWIVAVLLRLSAEVVAAAGFRLTQPVSVLPPGTAGMSAWAVADSSLVLIAPLVPVLVLVAVDVRRRPLLASLGHGVILFALVAWIETISPVLGPITPGIGATLIALVLTGVAALAGAVAGRWLGGSLLRLG
jgi:hypothetical protein